MAVISVGRSQMQGDCRPLYASRLNRDLSHLLSHDFNCSSATMKVSTIGDSLQKRNGGGILIEISIHEGPYRRGYFPFCIDIPENYPFKSVAVWSLEPIWHPNIDFLSGKVALPMEWSPVLTLNSLAIAVQVVRLLILLGFSKLYSFYLDDIARTKHRKPTEFRSLFSLFFEYEDLR